MATLKQQYSGFKRTKWENKSDRQKVKDLNRQFTQLGLQTPKYIAEAKSLSPRQLGRALQRLENTYNRRIDKQTFKSQINKESFTQKKIMEHNKLVDKALDTILNSNLTSMEKQYLQGQVLSIPQLRQLTFKKHSNILDKIGEINFADNKARIRETKRIQKRISNINKLIQSGNFDSLYNEKSSDKIFDEMMNSDLMQLNFNDRDLEYLRENYNMLTPFEKELFIRNRLTSLRDRYKRFAQGDNDEGFDETSLYNGILYSMQYMALENRDVSLIDEIYRRRRGN